MKSADQPSSKLQKALNKACKGTNVTVRELYQTLNFADIIQIRQGEITSDDLRAIVDDMSEDKDNWDLYHIPMKKPGQTSSYQSGSNIDSDETYESA